jgi:hypothetical protein
MRTGIRFHQRGQSLVIIAVLMVVFFGMLAIVLDGGYAYSNRRAAQVAADAGALAGAREYCLTGDVNLAVNRAAEYATVRNKAVSANITVNSGEVTVETFIPFNTFFARLFGQPNMTAAAVAAAGCQCPGEGTGILPIAWSCRPPVGGSGSPDCQVQYQDSAPGDNDGQCTLGQDPMYIIMDSASVADDVYCQSPPNSGLPAGALDCDVDDDGVDDISLLSGGNRAWLDLNGGGGGASSLTNWVQNGYPGQLNIHTWFPGQTGVDASVFDAVADYQLGNYVLIPVFDQYCPDEPSTACPGLVHGVDTIVGLSGAGDFFHVISFALFHITCVESGSHGPCPANIALGLPPNEKTIEGCFVQGIIPDIGGGGSCSGGIDVGAYILGLTR